jgi:hypothetical protein
MLFGAIARDDKSALIVVEAGTVNAEGFIDDRVDQFQIRPDMNQKHGARGWTFMYDGAFCHRAACPIGSLNGMVNVLPN